MENKILGQPIPFDKFIDEYKKTDRIPSFVYEAVNKLLFKKWDGKKATITQDEIIDSISIPTEYDGTGYRDFRKMIFDNHWLDIEDSYNEKGWHVEYDKPAYCEDYVAYFTFIKKK